MKVEITEAQLRAIMNMTDDMSAMIGCGDDDSHWVRYVAAVDRFLKKNGFSREHN